MYTEPDDDDDDMDEEGDSPNKPRIGFTEPDKAAGDEEDVENWVYDPLRWHPALGIKVLPPIPQTVGARIGVDGNMEIFQVLTPL